MRFHGCPHPVPALCYKNDNDFDTAQRNDSFEGRQAMQQRAIETRNKILAAAVSVFAAKGLNGATVDDIAAAAGVNKQRLYAYFGSKQGLFDAALLHRV